MDFSQLVTAINEVTAKVNLLYQNAKKIVQLPSSTPGRKLVAVWNEAEEQTQQFNLSDALTSLNSVKDGILGLGTITRSGNDFTFSTGFVWKIQGLNYSNDNPVTISINTASPGFYRTDIIVLDANGGIFAIEGVESDTISIQPPAFPDTIYLCYFTIFGDTVQNPSEPTLQGQDNVVRNIKIPRNLLSGTGTEEEQICEYILSMQEADRTIAETDSKWNVILTDAVPVPEVQVFNNIFNNKFQ